MKAWAHREALLSETPGFLAVNIEHESLVPPSATSSSSSNGNGAHGGANGAAATGMLSAGRPHAPSQQERGVVVCSVTTLWASIPEWEAWSRSPQSRKVQLPEGVYQFVPARGEGFPEDFVPLKDFEAAVDAKY